MIISDSGDIKVINEKGTIKWFSKQLVDDAKLMQREGFTVVERPAYMEAVQQVQDIEENEVADSAPAKRGRPSTK